MAFGGTWTEDISLHFPEWKQALDAADLDPAVRGRYARETIAFFAYCKRCRAGATVARVRLYLETLTDCTSAREALRWLFRASRIAPDGQYEVPVAGVSTFGGDANIVHPLRYFSRRGTGEVLRSSVASSRHPVLLAENGAPFATTG